MLGSQCFFDDFALTFLSTFLHIWRPLEHRIMKVVFFLFNFLVQELFNLTL